jgi:thiol-disulfide isomerase/thioredoxin
MFLRQAASAAMSASLDLQLGVMDRPAIFASTRTGNAAVNAVAIQRNIAVRGAAAATTHGRVARTAAVARPSTIATRMASVAGTVDTERPIFGPEGLTGMDAVLLLSRLLLSAVFGTAGLAKLVDREGSKKSLIGFGLPKVLAPTFASTLPALELLTSILLLPVESAWWGAVLGLILLLAFTAAVGTNLILGRRPDCHCFGQLHSEPAGWPTLVRNGALATIAGLLVWQGRLHPGPSAVAWLGSLSIIQAILVVVGITVAATLALQGWLLVQLLRQHGRLLLRMDALERTLSHDYAAGIKGLPVGAAAPSFQLPDLDGNIVQLDQLLRTTKTAIVLVFVDPGCGPCAALAPELAILHKQHESILFIALVSRGGPGENRAIFGGFGAIPILLQDGGDVARAYHVHGTPAAIAVDQHGKVVSPIMMGSDQIRSLIASASRDISPGRMPNTPSARASTRSS